ncbi:MAG: CDP-diacylglycerol--glycerol-3-phosphate 3-phosphatidyltransferase [Deltaproteobacteria bacterium]|nr:CDP-diacylglycerol--glycerol-3-phosphate 3-phosphatidyltransferase [Deltaproteobacteria bacterium]MBW1870435.1 CDP-diacylglycerol--glycerol-3-phosphate 3-phosphatidyltransferase [Deltaproteobacteria bacterium]
MKKEFFNLPNMLTMFRILIIPLVLFFIYYESRINSFIAACLFALASATDYFDGYLARRKGLITVFGKFLDPLADKLIVTSVLVMLIPLGRIPAWVVVLLLARELAITGLRGIASSEGLVIAASQGGKWKTAFQLVGILALLIHYPYPVAIITPGLHNLVAGTWFHELLAGWGIPVRPWVDFHIVGLWLIYLSLFFSVFSAWQYIVRFVRTIVKNDGTDQQSAS